MIHWMKRMASVFVAAGLLMAFSGCSSAPAEPNLPGGHDQGHHDHTAHQHHDHDGHDHHGHDDHDHDHES